MSNTRQIIPEVISIEDDEDEDVEVVFANLNKSRVYRNLICQKISQEIELLQAMSTRFVPKKFDQFREQAKKLGDHYGDDVIQSAWQRLTKKYTLKETIFPNDTAPVCLVRPLQPTVDISPPQATALSSPHSSVTGPSSSPPIASTAVPVALLLNAYVRIENSPHQRTEGSVKRPILTRTSETDKNDENGQTPNANDSADKQVVSALESRCSQIYAKSASNNRVSIDKKYSEGKTCVFSSDSDKQGLSKSGLEESGEIQNSFASAFSESYFDSAFSEQNRLSEKKKVTTQISSQKRKSSSKQVVPVDLQKIVDQADKQVVLATESRCSKTDSETAGKNNVSSDNNCSFSISGLGESDEIQNSIVSALSEGYFHSAVSEPNQLDDTKKATQTFSRKRKSSSKQVVPMDSPKTVDQAISKSHVGVKAKIVRTKQTSLTNSRKRPSKMIKEMSEAELKEFKAEQKILKYKEKREFEMQQLQKVHDRLVDVLIPKYYNKGQGEKS